MGSRWPVNKCLPEAARSALLLIYWSALAVATHLPPAAATLPGHGWDKLAHAGSFAALGALAAWSVRRRSGPQLMIVGALYAAVDEWTQAWVGRQPEFADWLADAAGLACGLWLTLRLKNRRDQVSSLESM